MTANEKSDLFLILLQRVKDVSHQQLEPESQAFGRWFANMYFLNPHNLVVSDGSKDGKIDLFFATSNGRSLQHHALNTKFTTEFNKIAPRAFYDEIQSFWQVFENRNARSSYLEKAVKTELRPHYSQLFKHWDAGEADLMFLTNHRCNEAQFEQVRNIPVKIFHLDELLEYLIDDLDVAMPETPPIALNAINALLSADKSDTEVPTSIVFARLVDFVRYMEEDPFDLLFMRNVRVPISFSRSAVNRAIRDTFRSSPKEFAFSNNGITIICEQQHYDPGQKVLTLENPRVVNGSQTLHSIRDVPEPQSNARVMVRVIEIQRPKGDALGEKIARRKEIINKIALRSNQQNSIKKWDLVSNDDFQLELFRFFKKKGRFYERRNREWALRSRALRSVGVRYGINIKRLSQLIASFHWSKPKLGPAVAKTKLSDLFDGDAYEAIRQTDPALAYQLFLLDEHMEPVTRELAKKKAYITKLKSYADLALFALAIRALDSAGAEWGQAAWTESLEKQRKEWEHWHRVWHSLTEVCLYQIQLIYSQACKLARHGGEELSYANYFKNQSYVGSLLEKGLNGKIKQIARQLLKT